MCLIREVWKDIPDYEGLYQVSNMGRVKSLNYNHTKKEQVMKYSVNKGYFIIRLSNNKKRPTFFAHRLVASVFIPNPDNLPCVNHKDENKENNNVSNLEWVTPKENVNYGTRNERAGKNISKAMKGKPKSEEHKRKMSELRKNKKLSEKTKKKLIEVHKKPIIQYTLSGDFVKLWDSTITASIELNISKTSICMCLKNKYKSAGGYVWRYKDVT